MKNIWYYNVLNNLYLLKYNWHIISKRWEYLRDKIHIHDWVYFEYKVTKKMEIYDLIHILIPLLTYFSYRSTNTKINERIKYASKHAHH